MRSARTILPARPLECSLPPDDLTDYVADQLSCFFSGRRTVTVRFNTHARNVLVWELRIALEAALQQTIDWMRENWHWYRTGIYVRYEGV